MADVFGKTPYDYAKQTKDRLIIEAVVQGIYESEPAERERLMRTIPLSSILEHSV